MNAERETKMHTCKRGHTTEVHRKPSGNWSECTVCARARGAAWEAVNVDRVKTKNKAYCEAVKQLAPDDEIKLRRKAYMKAWHEAHKETIYAYKKAWYKRAKEKRET